MTFDFPDNLTGLHLVGHARATADTPPSDLAHAAAALFDAGFRLALVAAHDDGDALRVVYLFTDGPPDRRVELSVAVNAHRPVIPSIARQSFPASRFEREIHDLFGIEPTRHPRLARLVLHQHWPEGWHPMRRDAGPTPAMADEDRPFPFLQVEGRGVYEIPVGPVHAGLIEPGHFRFSVVGETILNVKARLWYVHKGIERLFQDHDAHTGVALAERISGDSAVGHNLAYCLAVEDATHCDVSRPDQLLRAMLLELERLYNHIADVGALCNDVGFGVVNAHALRIRERLLRLNAEITGHRLLRGAIVPGGASVLRLPTPSELDAIATDFHEVVEIALANSTVVDRFNGTAILTNQQAAEIGALGYVARASGLGLDARVAHPFIELPGPFTIARFDSGDVMARFRVRVQEFDESVALIGRLLDEAEPGAHPPAQLNHSHTSDSGVGIVEGWHGSIVHRIEMDRDGRLRRIKIVDPSFMNWPALPVALTETIVPDFPLANKSFNLSYAGNDL